MHGARAPVRDTDTDGIAVTIALERGAVASGASSVQRSSGTRYSMRNARPLASVISART
jgi:hypothetical protein